MKRPGKIRSLAPWFGGKRTLADTIVEVLGTTAPTGSPSAAR
jgi:hypothetical protein